MINEELRSRIKFICHEVEFNDVRIQYIFFDNRQDVFVFMRIFSLTR